MNNFIIVSMIFLAPAGSIIISVVLFLLGKFIWWNLVRMFPELKPIIIDFITADNIDFIYFETAILFLFLVFTLARIITGV